MNKYITLVLLYLPILSGLYYINQFAGILEFILGLIMYLAIFYFFHVVWTHYRKKNTLSIIEYGKKFYISLATLLFVCVGILSSFGYYHLIYRPLNLEQVTISNGEKTVVFQKMIHIAKPNYYKNIVSEIKYYKNKGYIYYFEGVKGGTDKSIESFNKALGIEFDVNLYDNLSKLYGLIPQNNQDYLQLINNKDYNIDLNIDEIISEYNNLKLENNITKEYKVPIDVNTEIINSLAELNSRQLKILQLFNLSIITALTKNETVLQGIQDSFGNQLLFEIILDGRNKIVIDSIIKSEDKNIFATYGALHFAGILKGLQEHDGNWKIISNKSFFPFQENNLTRKK